MLASAPVSSLAASTAAPGTVPVAAAPRSSDNTLKIVLIIVGALVLIGVMGLAGIGIVGWRIAHHTRVQQEGNNVKVETPFGTVESTKDPEEAARNLGVDIYPGAEVVKEGAAVATFGGMRTASATFESGDPLDKVATFYKAKFPNAMVTASQSNHCTIVSNDPNNLITIKMEARGDKTRIQIAKVTHNPDSASQ